MYRMSPDDMNLPTFPHPRRRGIYILPNLFTTAALFCGFYSIVQAMTHNYVAAAIAIFVGMVFDGLDGRIARLTNTQSEFGAQYDSLSDMVCFGAAPALVAFEWALAGLSNNKLGWIISFIYCASAALRLARFNTNIDVVDKRFFQGLPSPAAAALVAGLVWVSIDNGLPYDDPENNLMMPIWLRIVACLVTLFAGISMVSNIPFWSGKAINLRKSVPFIVIIALVLGFALGATYPPGVFFSLFVAYAVSGYIYALWIWRRNRRKEAAERKANEPVEEASVEMEDDDSGDDDDDEDDDEDDKAGATPVGDDDDESDADSDETETDEKPVA